MFLYMYIAPGSEFLYKHKPFVTLVICCKFLPLNDFLTVFPPYKSIRDQIWPCRTIGQDQPRVIIWTNYDGPKPQCYIPSHKVIGALVLEKKIFEAFLPYMGVAAILVMWHRPRKQTFIPPSHWGSIWNLALTVIAVLEKKIFENGGQRRDGWTDDGPWLYY